MAWADADLKIFAAGLAIGGKWNNRGGSGSSGGGSEGSPLFIAEAYLTNGNEIKMVECMFDTLEEII